MNKINFKAASGNRRHFYRVESGSMRALVWAGGYRQAIRNAARGSSSGGGDRLANFLSGKGIFPFISKELMAAINNPIRFRPQHGGGLAYGYPATEFVSFKLTHYRNARKFRNWRHLAVLTKFQKRYSGFWGPWNYVVTDKAVKP